MNGYNYLRSWNGEIELFLDQLDPAQRDALKSAVDAHEAELDCSDGPVIAFEEDSENMREEEYSCCGWEETRLTLGGRGLVIGSCWGH